MTWPPQSLLFMSDTEVQKRNCLGRRYSCCKSANSQDTEVAISYHRHVCSTKKQAHVVVS